MFSRTRIGNSGERVASRYLEELGYKIIDRNFRIRGGEIDLIALENDDLVFIEVKTRYSHEFGLPIDAITPWKIKFILKSALFYIQKIKWGDKSYRIDVVSVDFTKSTSPQIELYRNITAC